MDNLKSLMPGRVLGRAPTFKNDKRAQHSGQKAWSKAARLRDFYGLQAVDNQFVAMALGKLPESLVAKCMVAANELGKNPGRYFIACIKNEIAERGL